MFVLNPDQYSLPCYRIGPFQTRDLSINHNLQNSDVIDDYFQDRFGDKDLIYTINGRRAINIALGLCNLKKNDVVTILTTTENFYISSCVTKEIENYCKWSRKIIPETKVLFVNHEFGYPYIDIKKLKEYKLPIIEDCAHSFFSRDTDDSIGKTGDFVIYSFPKMFPLQIGGLLVSNIPKKPETNYQIGADELRHIKNVLSAQIKFKDEIIRDRISHYRFLRERFESLGFKERFNLDKGVVPGVFMFKTDGHKIDLPELKKYYWDHGVQCSVFYGENAFFIPVHQNLGEHDMQYFYEIMGSFIQKNE
ncbi:MAG: DegT/DnrJ/EryC1/StrS family aminotransferase [Bacteroidales bacterium]|nr:DegT/DnrJ/EryC1/StrS family aminotransferase [Bacteroidales bacterium]